MTEVRVQGLTADEAVVRSAFDAINRRDVKALRALWHPELAAHHPPGEVLDGPDAVAAAMARLFAAVPDLHVDPCVVAWDEERVIVRWEATGTFDGRGLYGIRATGRPFAIRGFSSMTFARGLVRRDEVLLDGADLARQLGLLPARGSLLHRGLTLALNARTLALGILDR